MSTIKLTTAYQLVITSLLLGACLGLLSRQLPLSVSTGLPIVSAMAIDEIPSLSGRITNENSTAAPIAVIGADLVNLRTAPALTATVVGQIQAGQQLQIVGRDSSNSWWLVCCYAGRLVWISAHVVNAFGDLSEVTVVSTLVPLSNHDEANENKANENKENQEGRITSLSMAKQGTSSLFVDASRFDASRATTVTQDDYQLVGQQQYEERVTPRIYLLVDHQRQSESAADISDLGLLVKKDGIPLVVPTHLWHSEPILTWPTSDQRQQSANLKVEFPHIDPTGIWEIQLIDSAGMPMGPVARFAFGADAAQLEMYLHYQKL